MQYIAVYFHGHFWNFLKKEAKKRQQQREDENTDPKMRKNLDVTSISNRFAKKGPIGSLFL
jgi:hypothetical protein